MVNWQPPRGQMGTFVAIGSPKSGGYVPVSTSEDPGGESSFPRAPVAAHLTGRRFQIPGRLSFQYALLSVTIYIPHLVLVLEAGKNYGHNSVICGGTTVAVWSHVASSFHETQSPFQHLECVAAGFTRRRMCGLGGSIPLPIESHILHTSPVVTSDL